MHNVELVGITKPMHIGDGTPEGAIVYMARVSNPGNQDNPDGAEKLIRYLIKNAHWSPFEMISMVVEIKTTRDISRQILRHRSFSFQEFSQRYAKAQEFTTREARLQDLKNRQNSIEISGLTLTEQNLIEEWNRKQEMVLREAQDAYDWALEKGIAKEQARVLLPEGLTMSTLYMSGTLRSFIHFCQLRMANGTQKEHSLVAKDIWKIVGQNFPNVVKALEQ
jgi:thymidylate synthase (FAD)